MMIDTTTASQATSPFEGFYNNPLPHDYFGFLSPVNYRAPDETMAVLRPWLVTKAEENPGRPIRVLDFFCGYGANGLLLRTGMATDEISILFAEGALRSEDFAEHKAFLSTPKLGPDQVHLTGLDIAANALAYARDTGVYQEVYDDNLREQAPSSGLAKAAFEADIIIESGGHHAISAPIIDGLLAATNPALRPPLMMTIARDFDRAPIIEVLHRHGYHYDLLKQDLMLRRFNDPAERAERHGRNRLWGLPTGGPLGDNVRYADLFWATATPA
ncbi:MAG: hypothetical protein AAF213_12410 [Pseudomonadota bacterium]